MLIVDPPAAWGAVKEIAAATAAAGLSALGLTGDQSRNAALYFPASESTRIKLANRSFRPLRHRRWGNFQHRHSAGCGKPRPDLTLR